MSIIDKIFNYSEDYRYKTWKIFGIKFSVVKKYNSKKINIYEEIKKHDIISFDIFDTLLIRPYVKPTDLFLHIEKIIDTFLQNNIRARNLLYRHQNNIGVSIMLGLSAFSCFNKNDKNKENNYWRNFGFIYGGPAVFSYMNWLKKQIIKENIKEVIFVARDGYSLKRVFDLIKPESVKTHYIYAPRIIYYLIALDFKYYNLGDSVKSVLEYYKDKDEYLEKHTPKITSATQGYKFILDNIEIYKNLAKQEYQNYKEYIEKFNIDKDNIGIVDTRSLFKTSQKIISLFLGKENIIGYYWILFKNKYYKSNQYKAKSFE